MKDIRQGIYGTYQNEYYELLDHQEAVCELIYRGDANSVIKEVGFERYADCVYTLKVKRENISSVFDTMTFCLYKGFKCQVLAALQDGKYRIALLDEAQQQLNDYARHGYDPIYEVEEKELEEIWEERKPIKGFEFKEDPVFFIKKRKND